MCCLNPTRAGIIEFVFRGYKKNVDVRVVRMVGASLFFLDCQQQGVGGKHLHQFRLEIRAHKSRILTIIAIMKQMVLLAVAVILGDSALEPRMAQSRHVNPVFHSRRVYFPDFSRHISHLCFLSRCQRERERERDKC